MILYLLRHGEAGTASSDEERELTPKGQSDVKAIAQWLKSKKVKPDVVWTSPYIRAEETAKILAAELKLEAPETVRDLTPDADPEDLIPWLQIPEPSSSVLIVSHMPYLGYLSAALLESGTGITFETAGVAAIRLDEIEMGLGMLEWVSGPSQLKVKV